MTMMCPKGRLDKPYAWVICRDDDTSGYDVTFRVSPMRGDVPGVELGNSPEGIATLLKPPGTNWSVYLIPTGLAVAVLQMPSAEFATHVRLFSRLEGTWTMKNFDAVSKLAATGPVNSFLTAPSERAFFFSPTAYRGKEDYAGLGFSLYMCCRRAKMLTPVLSALGML